MLCLSGRRYPEVVAGGIPRSGWFAWGVVSRSQPEDLFEAHGRLLMVCNNLPMTLDFQRLYTHNRVMNLTVCRHNSAYPAYHSNEIIHQGYDPFQAPSPLGMRKPGMGSMLGGVVGAVLGQMLCPVPFLGAMLGGLIGSMFGSMLDSIFGASAPCCSHNMGQQYGPYNQQMAFDYGYPTQLPYLPQGFPNPPCGCGGPLFPPQRKPLQPWGLPRVGPSEEISSREVAPRTREEISVRNRPEGIRVDTEIRRRPDGVSEQVTDVQNRRNPDAAIDTTTRVGPGGTIETVSTPIEGGVQNDTVAVNANGTAATRETTLAREERTDVVLTDVDSAPGNMEVVADENRVVVTNPGTPDAGPVQNEVDISESSSDGFFENLGRRISGGDEEPAPAVAVDGVGQVHVSRNEEGQATVTVANGGDHQHVLTTAGDTDDGIIERAGEVVDNTISAVGNAAGDVVDAVGDAAHAVGDAVGDAAHAVGDAVGGAANAVGDAASRGWSTVRGWFS